MSLPNEADFAVIKIGDGESPEAFSIICGIENVSLNKAVASNDRYRRDCTKLGKPAVRKNIVTGKSLTITGSGAANVDNIADFEAALGVSGNYQIELRQYDGTDAGSLMGTVAGAFVLVADNISLNSNADSTGEITLNNEGVWTYTAA